MLSGAQRGDAPTEYGTRDLTFDPNPLSCILPLDQLAAKNKKEDKIYDTLCTYANGLFSVFSYSNCNCQIMHNE